MIDPLRRFAVFGALALAACTEPNVKSASLAPVESAGFAPNIVVGPNRTEDVESLERWISESVTLMTSPAFEANLRRVAQAHPHVWISRQTDAVPTLKLLEILHRRDVTQPHLWWPETRVVLKGDTAIRLPNRRGYGFNALRNAGAEAYPPGPTPTRVGQIELGRLHFARYTRGDVVERSCALNTMVHEISHTLSDQPDRFWMHILDTGRDATPPAGMYEASYLIGTIAQCTWLQSVERIGAGEFDACLETFSNPRKGSRFGSRACDDFPNDKPITPAGRLLP